MAGNMIQFFGVGYIIKEVETINLQSVTIEAQTITVTVSPTIIEIDVTTCLV